MIKVSVYELAQFPEGTIYADGDTLMQIRSVQLEEGPGGKADIIHARYLTPEHITPNHVIVGKAVKFHVIGSSNDRYRVYEPEDLKVLAECVAHAQRMQEQ